MWDKPRAVYRKSYIFIYYFYVIGSQVVTKEINFITINVPRFEQTFLVI